MGRLLEDTGPGKVPYMINARLLVITEGNFSQTNVAQVVDNQLRDGTILISL